MRLATVNLKGGKDMVNYGVFIYYIHYIVKWQEFQIIYELRIIHLIINLIYVLFSYSYEYEIPLIKLDSNIFEVVHFNIMDYIIYFEKNNNTKYICHTQYVRLWNLFYNNHFFSKIC